MKTMKSSLKIAMIVICLLSSSVSFSQITDVKVSNEIVIDKIYAGSLSAVNASTDSLSATGSTGLRFGAMATYRPTSWLAFRTWAMCQIDPGKDPWSLQQFFVNIHPIEQFNVDFGYMATIATELRPHPVSAGGQFETWAQSQIPGSGLGAKLRYQFTPDFQAAGGIAVRNGLPEYASKFTYKNIQVTGWYSEYNKKFGAATIINSGRISTTLVWKQNQTLADLFTIELSKKESISFFSDMGYDLVSKNLVRGEAGLWKGFESTWINGLVAMSYDLKAHAVNGYLFVHL